jgi:uncharacterized peroxidase-related enzyme
MADESMTEFDVPESEDLPEDVRDRIAEETEQAGFTPNVFEAFAFRPRQFRAFFAYHDALVEDSALAREEIEMIIVTTSGINDCYYCIVAHGALLRIYGDDPLLADQLAANHRAADLSERHRAMLDVVETLTESPGEVDSSDVERLREVGFSEEAIWDVASVTAYYNLSNRMANFADMRPNEEFHTLGRPDSGDD